MERRREKNRRDTVRSEIRAEKHFGAGLINLEFTRRVAMCFHKGRQADGFWLLVLAWHGWLPDSPEPTALILS